MSDSTHQEFILRRGEARDLDIMLKLEEEFPSNRLNRRSLRNFLKSASAEVLIFEAGGQIYGDAIVVFRRNAKRARLYSMVINPNYRRHGVGSRLLEETERCAAARGCTMVVAETRPTNTAALNMIVKHGWAHLDTMSDYYDDGGDAVRYFKTLTPA